MRSRSSCFSPVCHWGNSRSGRSLTDPPEHLVWTRMFRPTTAHIHHYIYTMTISLDLSAITGWVGCVSLSFQNTVCAPQGFHVEITLTPHLPVQVHPGLSPCWLPPVQFDEGFPVYPQVVIHPGFYRVTLVFTLCLYLFQVRFGPSLYSLADSGRFSTIYWVSSSGILLGPWQVS